MDLSNIQTILFDGDGVLWRADEKVPGVDHIFSIIHQHKLQWALLTNNNTKTVQDYINKLVKFGIPAETGNVFSSLTITLAYLTRKYGSQAAVFVVGMPSLIETLQQAGFRVYHGEQSPPEAVKAVVAGMDREITHAKIKVAMRLILGGAEFIATNTDSSFPTPEGINPGTGMVIGALIGTTNVQPVVMGKPGVEMFLTAVEQLGAKPETTVMIGDRLNTDIQGAKAAGLGSILVLTGVTTAASAAESDIHPDLTFPSVAELAAALEKSYHA
jgi:4-nitrophenyl phosphatase